MDIKDVCKLIFQQFIESKGHTKTIIDYTVYPDKYIFVLEDKSVISYSVEEFHEYFNDLTQISKKYNNDNNNLPNR